MSENYISVSDYAKFIGKTTQTVYNMIKDGVINVIHFNRGSMVGILIEKPAGFDDWLNKSNGTEHKS